MKALVTFNRHAPVMRHLPFPLLLSWLTLEWLALVPGVAWAIDDAGLCQQAIASAEQGSGVPNQLLDAISRVESGRYDAQQGGVRAWPWTINVAGQGHYYASRAEAVAAAAGYRASGIKSMDVGCTQINLMYHPAAFGSLEAAFDPAHNAAYAAGFLTDLFHQTGSWPHAAAAYHSQTPELGTDYQRKVLEAWAEPIDGHDAAPPGHRPAHVRIASSNLHPGFESSTPDDKLPGAKMTLASSGAVQPTAALSASGLQASFGRPATRSSGAPLGGYGRIVRLQSGAPMAAGGGRGLSAYRLMPVALLASASRLVAHN